MLEVIKILIEEAFKLINIKRIVSSYKGNQKANIGEILFNLYSDLNQIYVTGSIMVDEIEFVVRKRKQYLSEKRDNETIPDIRLSRIVKAQQSALYRFAVSFQRATNLIDVVDPETTRRLTLFLHTKINILNLLNGVFVGKRKDLLLSSDAESKILSVIDEFFREKDSNNKRGNRIQNELEQAVSLVGPEINVGQITVAQAAQFERYIELRKPREHLEELKIISSNFREEIIKNFSIEDILLKVGSRHNVDDDPEVIWHDFN